MCFEVFKGTCISTNKSTKESKASNNYNHKQKNKAKKEHERRKEQNHSNFLMGPPIQRVINLILRESNVPIAIGSNIMNISA
jgi:hypothetical protein